MPVIGAIGRQKGGYVREGYMTNELICRFKPILLHFDCLSIHQAVQDQAPEGSGVVDLITGGEYECHPALGVGSQLFQQIPMFMYLGCIAAADATTGSPLRFAPPETADDPHR